ncbi:amidohydrolase family protein [Hymenobacter sp. H14-R3]|uniref:amidohydrolase family protein n=1 Tax=Hymenobacter sp. H14-R3 TaxID=3046308 RepID=UPI0024BB2C1E|nr:amidohydrolase family protein [Hymenobacter sp. H14-R3]MDJ0365349.1 amidohydrolase family protein [Hymenobacter sp. H14-R3]
MRAQAAQLADIGSERLRLMDEAGVTVQVLSVSGPGAELLSTAEDPAFAREYNDRLAAAFAHHPGRFAGFAHLPIANPAAAEELARTVREHQFCGALLNGTTQGRFLDDPQFAPLLARAEELAVPPSWPARSCPRPASKNQPIATPTSYRAWLPSLIPLAWRLKRSSCGAEHLAECFATRWELECYAVLLEGVIGAGKTLGICLRNLPRRLALSG